ncbi:MAG: flagellin FliC [Magnetococcales bacterium]|nr:flagellin FliC [Magnetococcales bacterium]
MGFAINTNVASLNAQRNLSRSTSALGTTFERLSSGLRINSAKDDAAGLSISTRMTAQIRGINQAVRNANDGISLLQVAEGALDETTNSLQRIRELAVQAANGTLVSSDREDLQNEVEQLIHEIQRVAHTTEFNDQQLLWGSFSAGKQFHVGADANQTIQVSIQAAGADALGLAQVSTNGTVSTNLSINLGSGGGSATSAAESAISRLDNALDSVADIRASLGALQNRFESTIANLTNVSENTSAARSQIMDADIAAETAALTRNSILQQAGTAILSQANQQPQLALQLLG